MDQAVADAFSMFDDDDDDDDEQISQHVPSQPPIPPTSKCGTSLAVPSADELAMIERFTATEEEACVLHEQEAERRKTASDGGEWERPSSVPFWKEAYPLYLSGSVQYQENCLDIGGLRGFCAATDIPPGALLSCERPVVTRPAGKETDESLSISIVRSMFEREDSQFILQQLSMLHPVNLGDEHQEMKGTVLKRHGAEIQTLLTGLDSEKHGDVTEDVIVRLLLVIRYNMYHSGLYLYTSIFNHSGFPNCVMLHTEHKDTQKHIAEIRACRLIEKNEPLTVCYVVRKT
jgi:hypothetical protein